MYKKTITYDDFNGVSRTEDFYFHLTKADLFNLEVGSAKGYAETLKDLIRAKDAKSLINTFMKLIEASYGVKSDDGRRFMRTNEHGVPYFKEFAETEAYSQLYMELAMDDQKAAEFIEGIMPKGIDVSDADKEKYLRDMGIEQHVIDELKGTAPATN